MNLYTAHQNKNKKSQVCRGLR